MEFAWNGYRETLEGKPSFSTMGLEGRSILTFFGDMPAKAITESNGAYYNNRRTLALRKDGTIWAELGRLRSAMKRIGQAMHWNSFVSGFSLGGFVSMFVSCFVYDHWRPRSATTSYGFVLLLFWLATMFIITYCFGNI